MSTVEPIQHIDMPGWRPIVRQVATRVVLVSLLPMAVFYTTLSMYGVRAAALVTATLYYTALFIRIVQHKPVLAVAMFAAGLLALRTVIVFWTGSAFLYFLQPVAGTVAVATAFAATTVAGRPVLERLAHDFCPLSPELSAQLRSAQFFSWISLVWTIAYGLNAIGTVWLLTTASIDALVLIKAFAGPLLTLTAGVATYLLFQRSIRTRNVKIRWAHHQGWARVAA